MPVKQATLNDHVNMEAINAYADRLEAWAQQCGDKDWPRDPTVKHAKASAALKAAAETVRAAVKVAQKAEQRGYDVAYEFYRWDWAVTEADGSVADRFRTEEEAAAALAEGGYPEGCTVANVPDPGRL